MPRHTTRPRLCHIMTVAHITQHHTTTQHNTTQHNTTPHHTTTTQHVTTQHTAPYYSSTTPHRTTYSSTVRFDCSLRLLSRTRPNALAPSFPNRLPRSLVQAARPPPYYHTHNNERTHTTVAPSVPCVSAHLRIHRLVPPIPSDRSGTHASIQTNHTHNRNLN